MANNFFDLVSDRFFSPFTSSNKQLNYDLLSLINRHMNDEMKQFSREEVVSWIIDYLENCPLRIVDDDTGEYVESDIKSKASERIRYFVSCGWLVDENDSKTLQTTYQMDSNAILLLNTMDNIVKNDSRPVEYTGYVYNIYSSLVLFEYNHATEIVEQLGETTRDFIDKLRGLNVSIKKFLKKLLANENLTPKEILNQLLVEYQSKVIVKNFNNLRDKDNPAKYRGEIIEKIDFLLNKNNLQIMVDDYIDKKKNKEKNEENIKEAEDFFKKTLEFVEDQFESIEDNLDSLNSRNAKYISTARSRLMFILNEDTDIEGRLVDLLKKISDTDDYIDDKTTFPLFELGLIDSESLYEPRLVRKKPVSFVENISENETDEEELVKARERLFKEAKFNCENVNNFIMEQLGQRNRMEAREMQINSFDDILKIFLAGLYSSNKISKYKVYFSDEKNEKIQHTFTWKNRRITNYMVERK